MNRNRPNSRSVSAAGLNVDFLSLSGSLQKRVKEIPAYTVCNRYLNAVRFPWQAGSRRMRLGNVFLGPTFTQFSASLGLDQSRLDIPGKHGSLIGLWLK